MHQSKKIITGTLLVFHLGLNAQVSVKSNGNIGLGTSAPQQKVHIAGRTLIEAYDNVLSFSSPNNAWQFMEFKRGGNRHAWMGLDNGSGFNLTKESAGGMNFNLQQGGNIAFNLNPSGGIFMNMTEGRLWVSGLMDNNQIGGTIDLVHPGKTNSNQAHDWAIFNMSGGYGNGLQFWAYGPNSCADFCGPRMVLMDDGKVGIGTNNPQFTLEVAGDVKGFRMITNTANYPDYVFHSTYRIRPLSEVEQYIQQYHHLPEVPTAEEVEKDGLNLGDHAVILLKKIEELTLYAIEQQKQIKALQEQVEQLKNKQNK